MEALAKVVTGPGSQGQVLLFASLTVGKTFDLIVIAKLGFTSGRCGAN